MTLETVDLDTAIGELTACGTVEKLRAKLKRDGTCGVPKASARCPIALYLSRRTGTQVCVSKCDVVIGWCHQGTPHLLKEFINNFDAGDYPELIEEEE